MPRISTPALPAYALLNRYAERPDCFTDCYRTALPTTVAFDDYVTAFYKTPLFRLERLILRVTIRRPSTDADAAAVAQGRTNSFAAWTVEDRTQSQLLMCDIAGRTRSWFHLAPSAQGTDLYFGSAVTPPADHATGLGWVFTFLLPFHKLYSRALLASAARGLR